MTLCLFHVRHRWQGAVDGRVLLTVCGVRFAANQLLDKLSIAVHEPCARRCEGCW